MYGVAQLVQHFFYISFSKKNVYQNEISSAAQTYTGLLLSQIDNVGIIAVPNFYIRTLVRSFFQKYNKQGHTSERKVFTIKNASPWMILKQVSTWNTMY